MDLRDFDSLPHADGQRTRTAQALWGEDDELGTLNLLTPKRILEAGKEIKLGKTVQLDLRLDHFKERIAKREAFEHRIIDFKERHHGSSLGIFGHDDVLTFNTQSSSQWDGLRHVGLQGSGTYYNGLSHEEIDRGQSGRLGIQKWVENGGIVGRGVLLDYHRWRAETNQPPVEPCSSVAITVQELEAVVRHQGLQIKPGDILMIRSGFVDWYNNAEPNERDKRLVQGAYIGIESSLESAKWIWNNHFAAVAGDAIGFECCPTPWGKPNCLHEILLGEWGCPIGELWNLEGLAAACAEAKRWSFFFTSAPLHVFGGVATPPNAIAVL